MRKILFLLFILPSICLGQITKPSSIDLQNNTTDLGQVKTLKCDGTSITCASSNLVGTISLAGGSNPWTESGGNLSAPITDTVTVGTSTTSLDTFTVQTNSSGVTVNYTPSGIGGIDSNTVTILPLDNNSNDLAFSPHTFTNSNVTFKNSSPNPEFTGVYYGSFNGSSSALSVASYASWMDIGTNWTYDNWIYPTTTTFGNIYYQGDGVSTYNYISISGFNTLDVGFFAHTGAGYEVGFSVAGNSLTQNAWNHVQVGRAGSTWYVFINGVSKALTLRFGAYANTVTSKSGGGLYFGSDITPDFYTGYMGEIRLSNVNRNTVGFTPATSAYTSSVTLPAIRLFGNGVQTAKIWTDGANGGQLTFTVGTTNYHTIDTSGNETFKGTFTNTTSTTGIGWSVKTGANTACNTTCGSSSCVFGFDTALAGSDVVNCASAIADTCVCAGS